MCVTFVFSLSDIVAPRPEALVSMALPRLVCPDLKSTNKVTPSNSGAVSVSWSSWETGAGDSWPETWWLISIVLTNQRRVLCYVNQSEDSSVMLTNQKTVLCWIDQSEESIVLTNRKAILCWPIKGEYYYLILGDLCWRLEWPWTWGLGWARSCSAVSPGYSPCWWRSRSWRQSHLSSHLTHTRHRALLTLSSHSHSLLAPTERSVPGQPMRLV